LEVGKSVPRVDAYNKVTGRALFIEDYMPAGALVARVLHSEVAHGIVKSVEVSGALSIPGVLRIFTCFDVPEKAHATGAGVWDPGHMPVADRRLLNTKVRFVGDDVAAVVAQDEISAARGIRAIKVTYEELPAVFTTDEAMAPGAPVIHDERPDNIVDHTAMGFGDYDDAVLSGGLTFYEGSYKMPGALHGHIETASAGAYMENGRVVVITGNQTIFSLQRIIADVLGLPWSMVRVVKPYVGGSFGNRQDALYEPLAAYLTTQMGGRPVWVKITQEETMRCTRSRHDIRIDLKSGFDADGRLMTSSIDAYSNQGGYASQGHNIVSNAAGVIKQLYPPARGYKIEAWTIYTNRIVAGALRGYGCAQGIFSAECFMDDIARARGEDPCGFRLKNIAPRDFKDPKAGEIFRSSELAACIENGKDLIGWDKKRAGYASQSGPIRRGVGMAVCCYKSSAFPVMPETSIARVVLGQDGMITLFFGAIESGQGTETVLTQMAADAIGVPVTMMRLGGVQDTDTHPYDNGSFGSRQTYTSGSAVKQAGLLLREKILDRAGTIDGGQGAAGITGGVIVDGAGKRLLDIADIARSSLFSYGGREQLVAEATFCAGNNPYSTAACFAEIEVDIPLGKIRIIDIVNIHDSGVIINPKTAESQVRGGMGMSIGSALMEQLIFDEKGALRNNNMLDYKIPTAMDLPDMRVEFADSYEPTGPYGNKSLGEPPALIPVAAIRNALLHATGVAVNDLPLSPERLVERFRDAGLYDSRGTDPIDRGVSACSI